MKVNKYIQYSCKTNYCNENKQNFIFYKKMLFSFIFEIS